MHITYVLHTIFFKSRHLYFWGQLFRKFNLDQNDLDLEIPCFAIQDQVINLTLVMVFQSKTGLDHPDPDTHFFRFPNLDY